MAQIISIVSDSFKSWISDWLNCFLTPPLVGDEAQLRQTGQRTDRKCRKSIFFAQISYLKYIYVYIPSLQNTNVDNLNTLKIKTAKWIPLIEHIPSRWRVLLRGVSPHDSLHRPRRSRSVSCPRVPGTLATDIYNFCHAQQSMWTAGLLLWVHRIRRWAEIIWRDGRKTTETQWDQRTGMCSLTCSNTCEDVMNTKLSNDTSTWEETQIISLERHSSRTAEGRVAAGWVGHHLHETHSAWSE